ncbi:hypothetical protein H7I53_24530 [Mycolicibacterium pulveris]|uniref:Uncharacterized protein n=1 Tax=Mycolicibacterium pulveris TaxID=36813 RepID=A0A7I7UT76_MYCPV|nr:hypothetical protein [Mycolicibacterium pulveris]MCV6983369.1 hypothetical protein [Mycolicibacterium pulveris]BBY83246.1 hypothetical protein MPUL_44040 [Mycolicibacterium pulveris]
MSGAHPDLGPELRQLAQTILDRLDPAVKQAAARAAGTGPGRCQQAWCPVCALAALVAGEQHPLLTVIAEHSVALLAVVRAILENTPEAGQAPDEPPPQEPPPDGSDGPGGGPNGAGPNGAGPGHYQHIPVIVEE